MPKNPLLEPFLLIVTFGVRRCCKLKGVGIGTGEPPLRRAEIPRPEVVNGLRGGTGRLGISFFACKLVRHAVGCAIQTAAPSQAGDFLAEWQVVVIPQRGTRRIGYP